MKQWLPVRKWREGGFRRREVITGAVFMLLLIPVLRNLSAENDINIFYLAAGELASGGNPYDGPHLYGMWYYYSPLFASLLVPFTFLPMMALKATWMALGFVMLNRIYILLNRYIPIPENKSGLWLLGLLGILSYNAVFMNLLYGQMTILLVWCCLESAALFSNGKDVRGGLVLAAGINVKILPVFLLWHYLLKRQFRPFFMTLAAIGVLVLLPYLFLRWGYHSQLIRDWFNLLNPLNKEHVNTVGEGGFIDFASLLTKYFSGIRIKGERDLTVQFWSHSQILYVQWAFRFFITFLAAWVVLKFHPRRLDSRRRQLADVAFFMLCIPCAFPHQRDYSVMLCIPAMYLMLQSFLVDQNRPTLPVLVLTLLSLTAMGAILFFPLFPWPVRHFIQDARIPGFGALLFTSVYLLWVNGLPALQQPQNK